MKARIDQPHTLSPMDSFLIDSRDGRKSFGALVRHWGPYILTVLVVPGGIVVVLLLLWRRWSQTA